MQESVLWPRGRRTVTARPVAPRLETLAGKTIGQLWDDLFRDDEIFPILEDALARRFPGVKFVDSRTLGSTHGAEEHDVLKSLPARMKEHGVDAVISGMVLRELHARRVADQCGSGRGGRPLGVAHL